MIVLFSDGSAFKWASDLDKFQWSHRRVVQNMSSLYETKSDRPSSGRDLSFSDDDYSRLKNIANGLIRREMTSTLTATGLVHEWFLKSIKSRFSPQERANELNESPQFPRGGRIYRRSWRGRFFNAGDDAGKCSIGSIAGFRGKINWGVGGNTWNGESDCLSEMVFL